MYDQWRFWARTFGDWPIRVRRAWNRGLGAKPKRGRSMGEAFPVGLVCKLSSDGRTDPYETHSSHQGATVRTVRTLFFPDNVRTVSVYVILPYVDLISWA